ncbi:hypothetical protein AXG94_03800 [Pseudomonas corrugata]|nr:hypothetical protein AXG94_03800 [Pseudomonas corrugata]
MAGFDATDVRNGCPVRIQIKGRCVVSPAKIQGRLGSIDLAQPLDVVPLVLLDSDFNAFAMYETDRVTALTKLGSKVRNEHGSLGIRLCSKYRETQWAPLGS